MPQRRGRWLTPVLLALVGGFVLLLFLVGLFAGGSASAGLSNGRSVTVHSNSWTLSLESAGDACTARTAGRVIKVAGDVISVDDQQLMTLNPEMKYIVIRCWDDEIQFLADGQRIAACPR